jgi:hypothetical protein
MSSKKMYTFSAAFWEQESQQNPLCSNILHEPLSVIVIFLKKINLIKKILKEEM